jgi:MFS transporter, ACS family, tartrate transporter
MLRRFGARRWISRIMISWGIITCATMFVQSAGGFYLVRILLGVAEAGFFPGIILYLSYWFPDRQRAKMTAYFMMAIALANVLGNPTSGLIMQYLDSVAGLKDWQWLFLLEGLPSVALGVLVLFWLTDRPQNAHWLTTAEREWLVNRMKSEETERQQRHGADRLSAMLNRRVWLLIAIYFTVAVGSNASGAYFPQLIREQFQQSSTFEIGLLSALPHLCAAVGMVLFSRSSDRTGERRGHVAVAALTAAAGWAISALATSPAMALAGFCLAQLGMMSMLPIFWTLPTGFLTGAAAAGGIALINSLANIGGFLGPTVLGQFGLWAMVTTMMVGAALAMCVQRDEREAPEA